ncbi:MAG: CRISPR-associated endonuclease Cas2 [Candidatus Heimdallarchaeaceae archaeon]
MEYLICYDIVDNDLRKKVSDACLNRGFVRIQYSVFYGFVSKNISEMLLIEIKELIKGKEAIITMLELCDSCAKKRKEIVSHSIEKTREEKQEKIKEVREKEKIVKQVRITEERLGEIKEKSVIVL